MKARDIVVGVLIVLVVVFGGRYLLRNKKETPKITNEPEINIESKLEDALGVDIPDDVLKVELKGVGGTGIFYPGSVVADLPEPLAGKFYEVWLKKGDVYTPINRLNNEKGGWILNFSLGMDFEEYTGVIVSVESALSSRPSEVVLEGSF
jgi:hypothetical protein